MELSLIRSLMDKPFYDEHRGAKCPDRLFSKDVRKIKQSVDKAMSTYERTVTPDEIEALFISSNPSMTTAQKQAYLDLFNRIKKEKPLGEDVAQEVLSKLFQQVVGEDIANIGFDYVNGNQSSLEPIRNILELYGDDFTPNLNIEWDDMSLETLISKNSLEAKWTSTGGFAHQGAKCVVLCNEESAHRVGARYLTSATGMTIHQIKKNPEKARDIYETVKKNIFIKDASGRDMAWVESVC